MRNATAVPMSWPRPYGAPSRAGSLSADQAQAVLAAERSGAETSGGGGGLPVTEALGYLGGLLALSGAVTLAVQYWRDVPMAGRLGLLALVAATTWLVGARIRDGSAPALIRLRSALWFASSAAVAALAGQVAWDVAHAGDSPTRWACRWRCCCAGSPCWRSLWLCCAGLLAAGPSAEWKVLRKVSAEPRARRSSRCAGCGSWHSELSHPLWVCWSSSESELTEVGVTLTHTSMLWWPPPPRGTMKVPASSGGTLMKVEEILKAKGRFVETIEVDASIAESIGRLNGPPQIGALVVCDENEQRPLVGTLTERDILRGLAKYGAKLLTMQVTNVMSRNVPVCSPEDSITRLMHQMTSSRYRHLPVVDHGELVGMVSIGDVVKARIADMELETGLLRDLYIARS